MLKIAAGAVWTVMWVMVQGPVESAGSVQRSTAASTGVYVEAQAERGKTAFATYCTGCHTVASQSGESFSKKWNGATAADLYKVLTEDMPKDDPGALTPKERTDVLAFLLKTNGFPAGTSELVPDPEPLKKIVIDVIK